MKHPQSKAITVGKYGCLAMCYLYCLGIEPEDEGSMINYIVKAMDKGLLDEECTVLDAPKFLFNYSGRKYEVEKKEITDISEIKEMCPVRFDYNSSSHWVVVADGNIIFNSLDKSVCVEKGKPTTARIMRLV